MEDKIKQLEAEIDQITAQFNFEIGKRRGMIELLKQQEEDKKKPIDVKEDKK